MKKQQFDYCKVSNDENRVLIEYYDNTGSQSIQRSEIGEINSFYNVYLQRKPIQYSFRAILLGIVLVIVGVTLATIAGGGFGVFVTWIGIIFGIGGILSLLFDVYLDGLLGTSYMSKMWGKIFGVESFKIIIKHKNGNDAINLFVSPDEKEEFLKYISSLKKETVITDLTTNNSVANYDDDKIEQIEKLSELHKKGILTDEEFSAKKKQILGI